MCDAAATDVTAVDGVCTKVLPAVAATIAQGSGERKSPLRSRGAKPRYVAWGRSPLEDEAVCRHCLQILTAETIKIGKFRTVHGGGLMPW